ncbi:hypothetical protein IJ732_08260 [bacterium]|nr:hypothetical protein [bacterium]
MRIQSINTNQNLYFNKPVSFGLHNPQAALERAKTLQSEYAKRGITYLLPCDVWSTKKIMKTTDRAIQEYNALEDGKSINSKALNNILAKLLPASIANKIKIGDFFSDFAKYLKTQGLSEFQISSVLNTYQGFTIPNKDKTSIFLKDKFNKADNNNAFAHELKHALTSKTTNIEARDTYKINDDKVVEKLFDVFHVLEIDYKIDRNVCNSNIDLTRENFLKNITYKGKNFKTKEDLYSSLEENVNKLFISNKLDKVKNNKYVYEFLQHYAKDEKEAYSTLKVLREDKNKPIGRELEQFKYEFFENFFKQKSAQLN